MGEILFLIDSLRVRASDLPPILFDPFCGAGSAACAAARAGMAFVGSDLAPARALMALAKSMAMMRHPRAKECVRDAVLVWELLGHPVGHVQEWIESDCELNWPVRDPTSAVYCADARETFGLHRRLLTSPVTMITSPPHPKTRGTLVDHDSQASILARNALTSFESTAGPVKHSDGDVDDVDEVLGSTCKRLAQGSWAIIEFETPPGTTDRGVVLSTILGLAGWQTVEIVDTYATAPDGPAHGSGGYVVALRT